ncbi:MAG: DUF6110 family protein [Coriobacteriales bacterium]|jgi:hypothetical protein|nr:DUF6110 family protein [Coriobacteriales bacterium]
MITKKNVGFIGAGFLLGTLGLKALTSKPAKKLYVQGVSKALQVKSAGLDIVEQAKSNLDDIVAEASYLNEKNAADTNSVQ